MDDKRTMAWFSAFVIVVLLIGIASGILLDRFLIRGPGDRDRTRRGSGAGDAAADAGSGDEAGPWRPGPGAGPMRPGLEERLAQQLELTAAQKDQVKAILERRRTRLDEVRAETQKRMEKEQEELRSEIRGVLTESPEEAVRRGDGQRPGVRRQRPGRAGHAARRDAMT